MLSAADGVSANRARRARLARRVVSASIIVPHAAVVGAFFWHQHVPLRAVDVGLFIAFALLTKLGITAGFHRLFSHRAYAAPAAIASFFAILGSMSAQGPLLFWVSLHRLHHARSDRSQDPHSPVAPWCGVRGFLHGHLGWMLRLEFRDSKRFVNDLLRDPTARFISRHYATWVALGLAIPAAIGAVAGANGLSPNWQGAVSGMLWGGLLRIVYVQHVTWCVNSVCHLFGSRPFSTRDRSRNNVIIAVLALGEGWHNNHHAQPRSARHGFATWQVDLTYGVIRALQAVGLASQVRQPKFTPSPARRAAR